MTWEPVDDLIPPDDLIAVTSYELTAGTKASGDGLIPCLGFKIFGNPHVPGSGEIDTSTVVEQQYVMQMADVPRLIEQLRQTIDPSIG